VIHFHIPSVFDKMLLLLHFYSRHRVKTIGARSELAAWRVLPPQSLSLEEII